MALCKWDPSYCSGKMLPMSKDKSISSSKTLGGTWSVVVLNGDTKCEFRIFWHSIQSLTCFLCWLKASISCKSLTLKRIRNCFLFCFPLILHEGSMKRESDIYSYARHVLSELFIPVHCSAGAETLLWRESENGVVMRRIWHNSLIETSEHALITNCFCLQPLKCLLLWS